MDEKHVDKSDRDLLIQVVNDMRWVKQFMKDHVTHHSRLFFAGLAMAGSLIVAMALMILTILT